MALGDADRGMLKSVQASLDAEASKNCVAATLLPYLCIKSPSSPRGICASSYLLDSIETISNNHSSESKRTTVVIRTTVMA